MKYILLFTLLAAATAPLSGGSPEVVGKPDVRVSVKPESKPTQRNKNGSSVAHRLLLVTIENREHKDVSGLLLRWKIISRNVKSRKLGIAASGQSTLMLQADKVTEHRTAVAHFAQDEGKTQLVGKGKNRHTVKQPDTGVDYAGYVVEIWQKDKLISEASTIGMREATKNMKSE